MRLFHGTNEPFGTIDLAKSKTHKDFGCGFYLSPDRAQAEAMAQFKVDIMGGEICVLEYEFDENALHPGALEVKFFHRYDEEWARFVLMNRRNASRRQCHPFDIVYGPIANDKVGTQIRYLEHGDIDLPLFLERIKYMRGITFQYFFGSERSLQYLHRL